MKAFIDTNVLLDIVARREPFFFDSQAVLSLCASRDLEGVVSDLTICNLAYVMRKQLDRERLRMALRVLCKCLTIVPVGRETIVRAVDEFSVDFEDAVQLRTAINAGAEFIITRNGRHFADAKIPVYTPAEFLDL